MVKLALPGVSVIISGLTYRPWIDGPATTYFGGLVASVGAIVLALWIGCCARSSWPVFILATTVALPAPVIHAARWIHRHHRIEQRLSTPLAYGAVLDATLQEGSSLVLLDDAVVVHNSAGSIGYLEVRRTMASPEQWWLPWSLATGSDPWVHETVTWTASIEREHTYFVVLDTGTLLIQLTSWGVAVGLSDIHLSRAAHDVPLAVPNGSVHTWTLDRKHGTLRLGIDGLQLLSLPDAPPFRFVRLGETRTDGEHGGTMRLSALRSTRTVD